MATSTAHVHRKERTRSSGIVLAATLDRAKDFARARVHTVFVRSLRLALPLLALAMSGYYVVTLRMAVGWGGLTLPTPPTFSSENLNMENPRYEGFSKDGGRFNVTAKTAKQDLKDRNSPVQLTGIDGNFLQPDKTVTNLKAKLGTFDSKQNQLELFDGIEVVSQSGMRATLTRATVLTKEHKIISREPVMVQMPTGTISGRQMQLDQKTRQIAFTDGVAARVTPERKTETNPPGGAVRSFGSSDAPVDITALRLDVDDIGKLAVFKGSVRAVQGESVLESEQLEISYDGASGPGGTSQTGADPSASSKLKRIVSPSPVVLTQGTDRITGDSIEFDAIADTARVVGRVVMTSGADRRAQSDRADMDQKADTILLTGNVNVMQGKNELKGRRLWVERKSGRAQLTGSVEAGVTSGRISTRLYQSDGKQAAGAKRGATQGSEPALPGLGLASFKTDPNAPIDIEAGTLDINDTAKTAVYRSDVRVVQGDFKMATSEMTAFYAGQMGLNMAPGQSRDAAPKSQAQLNKIEARKGVVVTSKDGQTANGEWADFDTKANTVTLGGNVKLTQGQTVVRGSRLVIDMTTGEYTIDPGAGGLAGEVGKRPLTGALGTSSGTGSTSTTPNGQGPFTPEATGRPRMVLYPQQFKAFGNTKTKDAAGQGTTAAQPASPAADVDVTQRKRRGTDGAPADASNIFGPNSSN